MSNQRAIARKRARDAERAYKERVYVYEELVRHPEDTEYVIGELASQPAYACMIYNTLALDFIAQRALFLEIPENPRRCDYYEWLAPYPILLQRVIEHEGLSIAVYVVNGVAVVDNVNNARHKRPVKVKGLYRDMPIQHVYTQILAMHLWVVVHAVASSLEACDVHARAASEREKLRALLMHNFLCQRAGLPLALNIEDAFKRAENVGVEALPRQYREGGK